MSTMMIIRNHKESQYLRTEGWINCGWQNCGFTIRLKYTVECTNKSYASCYWITISVGSTLVKTRIQCLDDWVKPLTTVDQSRFFRRRNVIARFSKTGQEQERTQEKRMVGWPDDIPVCRTRTLSTRANLNFRVKSQRKNHASFEVSSARPKDTKWKRNRNL